MPGAPWSSSSATSEIALVSANGLPPISLYVHFPWCVRKCPYCDFNSHPVDGEVPETAYIDRLCEDWDRLQEDLDGRQLNSVFLGGGTPSLLSAAAMARLLHRLETSLSPGAEITMEANPGTLEYDDLGAYRSAGINRLSLGVQSFDDAALGRLGRIHSAIEAHQAIAGARQGGFDNINLDLMHGLPGQTLSSATQDVRTALDASVEHVSYYQLTIEPRTAFSQHPPELPEEAALEDIEQAGCAMLAEAGFERYEVSAWARPGNQARHNRNYWEFGDYLGIGAGAHGKISRRAGAELSIDRTQQPPQPRRYLRGDAIVRHAVAAADRPGEFMMNALRLQGGVAESLFTARTGLPLSAMEKPLTRWRQAGCLHPERLALTPLGQPALDRIVADFLA